MTESMSVYEAHERAWVSGQRPDLVHAVVALLESNLTDDALDLVKMDMQYQIQLGETIGRVTQIRSCLPDEFFRQVMLTLYCWEWELLSVLPQPITRDAFLAHYPEFDRSLRNELKTKVVCTKCNTQTIANEELESCPNCQSTLRVEKQHPTVPNYEIIHVLGRGAMGVVYKARQVHTNRDVALKMIRSGRLATDTDVRRFREEVKAAASLRHENLVTVFDAGESDGQQFYTMELIDSVSLNTTITGLGGNVLAIAELMETIASAVQHMHQQGIMHRDLKPANILIDKKGQPHVTDFGLAKKIGTDSDMTRPGDWVGTPAYMAPEQAAGGEDVGCTVDVYSLGAILYELLSGSPPFRGTTQEIRDQLRSPDPVPMLLESTAGDLGAICMKCLQKDPDKRYASAAELAEDLRRFQNGEKILALPMDYREHWDDDDLLHPANYTGQVWIRVIAMPENRDKTHSYTVRWGFLKYRDNLNFPPSGQVILVHMKLYRDHHPLVVDLSLPCNIRIDRGEVLPVGHSININPGWTLNFKVSGGLPSVWRLLKDLVWRYVWVPACTVVGFAPDRRPIEVADSGVKGPGK